MRLCSWLAAVSVALLVLAGVGRAAEADDISKPGTYKSGQWEYRLAITGEGTKSQGTQGTLLFAGKELFGAAAGDFYVTPWGKVQWVGDPVVLWGTHGWFPKTDDKGGRELPAPSATGPVVMAMILVDAEGGAGKDIEPWVAEEVKKLGAAKVAVQRPWFVLGDQAVTVVDTKLTGRFIMRRAAARDEKTLTIICDGSEASNVAIDRKDGARKVFARKMGSAIEEGQYNYYVALKVANAAPDWPKPMDVGMESDGKEVVVKGNEVIIGLPGDRNSGCEWLVKSVQGDGIKGSSARAAGTVQFTPGKNVREGVFENTFRVLEKGKTYVELEYKRAWQKDKPAEKTFKVTLDVQEVGK